VDNLRGGYPPFGRHSAGRASSDRGLLNRYHKNGDVAAREALAERFLPLARRLARRYAHTSEPLEDLEQVASVGLLKAIDRYDPARHTAFSSFAVPTILGEIKRHFRDRGWAVRVPRDVQELAVRLERLGDDLARELGRSPTLDELAERAGATPEHVLEAREAAASAYRADSLDAPREGEGSDEAYETALGAEDPGFRAAEEAATMERLMQVLTAREREVLRLRFAEDLTQTEIGRRVGVSQMHVSRLLQRAIEKLRQAADE
jgi:RNA polymerase sigma-B factor